MTKAKPVPNNAILNEWKVPACPECGRFDFTARTALGLHRRQHHGILGSSLSAKKARIQKGPNDKPTTVCTHCSPPRTFTTENGLRIHQSTAHGIAGRYTAKRAARHGTDVTTLAPTSKSKIKVDNDENFHSNGNRPEITISKEPILTGEDLLIFKAIGRCEEVCRSLAESAGLPTLQFTGRVALGFSSEARRR